MTVPVFNNLVPAPPVVSKSQTLSRDDFLKLLVAQVKYQNPLEPTSNESLLNQIVQLTMLETLAQLQEVLEALEKSASSQATQAEELLCLGTVGLLGKRVEVLKEGAAEPLAGVVTGVSFREGTPLLFLGEQEVLLSEVTKVLEGGGENGGS